MNTAHRLAAISGRDGHTSPTVPAGDCGLFFFSFLSKGVVYDINETPDPECCGTPQYVHLLGGGVARSYLTGCSSGHRSLSECLPSTGILLTGLGVGGGACVKSRVDPGTGRVLVDDVHAVSSLVTTGESAAKSEQPQDSRFKYHDRARKRNRDGE